MTHHIPTEKLNTWLTQMVQGDISSEDLLELEQAMVDDLEVLDYCLEFLAVSSGLEWIGREKEEQGHAHIEKSLKQSGKLKVHRRRNGSSGWLKPVMRVAAVLLLGLGIGYAWRFIPERGLQGDDLAEIVNGLAAKWEDDSLSTEPGTRLTQGDRYLVEGMAELRMASGTRVVIKAPCRFSCETGNALHLNRGMVTANVPDKARGFEIRTPYITVVDHGTEFGVIAKQDGSVEAHVFAGKVELVATGQQRGQGLPLTAGISAKVSPGQGIKRSAANPVRFVRKLPKQDSGAVPGRRFDLADVVGIGNGYGTGALGCGINPANGEVLRSPVLQKNVQSVGGYVFLLNWRYIDGVFVPDGSRGDNAVTSTGVVFPNCPQTRSDISQGITLGAQMARPGAAQATFPARLGGVEYGKGKTSALGLHANAGITFDLNRIRNDHPGVLLSAFSAICGISESVPQAPSGLTEFWVLVDGQVRFHYQSVPGQGQAKPVHVPLTEGDHFLTLATTTPGSVDYCWALFAEPYLLMDPLP